MPMSNQTHYMQIKCKFRTAAVTGGGYWPKGGGPILKHPIELYHRKLEMSPNRKSSGRRIIIVMSIMFICRVRTRGWMVWPVYRHLRDAHIVDRIPKRFFILFSDVSAHSICNNPWLFYGASTASWPKEPLMSAAAVVLVVMVAGLSVVKVVGAIW